MASTALLHNKNIDQDYRYIQLIPKVFELVILMSIHFVQIWVLKTAGNENNFITLFPSISCDNTCYQRSAQTKKHMELHTQAQ